MSLKKSDITIKEGLKQFDEPSRHWAKIVIPKIYENIDCVLDHPNEYSIDLIAYDKNGTPVSYIEVEASHSWKTTKFVWKKLSFLEERKGRYLYESKYQDLDMLFVMFNKDFTSFAVTDRKSILKSPVEIHERTWKGKEKFRMIDRQDFKWYIIEDIL